MKYCIYCMKEKDEAVSICPHCKKDNSAYVPDVHILAPGTILNEVYIVGAKLGEGGFGITYIGRNLLLKKIVAIKEFYPTGMVTRNINSTGIITSVGDDKSRGFFSQSKDIFWKEAQILAEFNDEPGIVSVESFFTANNTAYIVTEYLDGETLSSYLARVGTISFDNTLCLLMPVMESLIKIHEKNLIHRDISPDNIMLAGESVKLIDFGATRQFADNKSLSVILKEGYAPAEQYSSKGNQGTWTDVYALCAVMYRCITGKVPTSASDRISNDDELTPPSELGAVVPHNVEQVLMKGLALKPKDRIQTIGELISEITRAQNAPEETSESASIPDPAPEPEPAPAPAPKSAQDDRLTHLVDENDYRRQHEEEQAAPERESVPEPPAPEPPAKVSKVKYIVAAAAAVVLIGGGIIFAVSGNKSDKGNKIDTEATSKSEVSEAPAETTKKTTTTAAMSSRKKTTTTTAKKETAPAEVTLEKEVKLPADFKPDKFKYELVINGQSVNNKTLYDTSSPIKVKSSGTTEVKRVEVFINSVLYVSYDFDFSNNDIVTVEGPNEKDLADSVSAEKILNEKDPVNYEAVSLISGWKIKRSTNLSVYNGILLMNTDMFGMSLDNVCSAIGLKKISLGDLEEYALYDPGDKLLVVRFPDVDDPVSLIFRNGKLHRVEYLCEYGASMTDLERSLFATRKNKLINRLGSPQFSESWLNSDDPKRAIEWNNELYICRFSLRPLEEGTGFLEQYFLAANAPHKYFNISNGFLNDNCVELIGRSKSDIMSTFGFDSENLSHGNFDDSGDAYEVINYAFNENEFLNIMFIDDKVFQIEYLTSADKYNNIVSIANSKGWNYVDGDSECSQFNIGNQNVCFINKHDDTVSQYYYHDQ